MVGWTLVVALGCTPRTGGDEVPADAGGAPGGSGGWSDAETPDATGAGSGGTAGAAGTASGGTAGTASGGTAGTASGGAAATASGGAAGTASGGAAGTASGGAAGTASGGAAGTGGTSATPDPCPAWCAAVAAVGCPGDATTPCLDDCAVEQELAGACREPWARYHACTALAPSAAWRCDFDGFAVPDATVCAAERAAWIACR